MTLHGDGLDTILLTALIGVVSYLGRRTLNQLDAVVRHLTRLNRRTEKLERRMVVVEQRHT